MNHCRDCKYFSTLKRTVYEWAPCLRPESPGALFEGSLTLETADVLVSPDFGCVQFERKADDSHAKV